jgi:kinesin family protein 2/24
VSDLETIKELIERGNATRSTGTTGANEESSRSHAILQLVIKKRVDGSDSKPPRLAGKLSFIDLAGSERGADTTENDKQTRLSSKPIFFYYCLVQIINLCFANSEMPLF